MSGLGRCPRSAPHGWARVRSTIDGLEVFPERQLAVGLQEGGSWVHTHARHLRPGFEGLKFWGSMKVSGPMVG